MAVLGICNPFFDRSALVTDSFLKQHRLKKDDTTNEIERAPVERTWQGISSAEKDVWTLGGSGTNVMKTLARLGHQCRVVGKIGSDERGFDMKERLVKIGIAPMLSRGKAETGVVNCFITDDKKRTMHTYLGAALELSAGDISREAFTGANHVHLEGYLAFYGETLETSVSFAKGVKATTSFDLASAGVVNMFRPKFQQNVPKMDVVFGNLEEMAVYTGEQDFKKAAECFGEKQTIIATDGKAG